MSRPTRQYALFIAGGFAAAGVIGAFVNNDFATNPVTRGKVLGLLVTNGWHNLFHLAFAPLALWVAGRAGASRTFALLGGGFYALLGIVGIGIGDHAVLFGLMPVNVYDSVIHLVLGALGLAAAWYAATARRIAPGYPAGV